MFYIHQTHAYIESVQKKVYHFFQWAAILRQLSYLLPITSSGREKASKYVKLRQLAPIKRRECTFFWSDFYKHTYIHTIHTRSMSCKKMAVCFSFFGEKLMKLYNIIWVTLKRAAAGAIFFLRCINQCCCIYIIARGFRELLYVLCSSNGIYMVLFT